MPKAVLVKSVSGPIMRNTLGLSCVLTAADDRRYFILLDRGCEFQPSPKETWPGQWHRELRDSLVILTHVKKNTWKLYDEDVEEQDLEGKDA